MATMGIENGKKHSLGRRAYFLFFSKRIKLIIFLFALTGAVWYSERWLSPVYAPWGDYATKLLLLLSAVYLLMMLLFTWLEYRVYTYMFTEEAFIVTSGYMIRTELAGLYHQIQNVNIQRGPFDRLTGVSKIVIYMTGDRESGRNRIVLPAVGKKKAKLVQMELLVRARRHSGNYPEAVMERTPIAGNRTAEASDPDR